MMFGQRKAQHIIIMISPLPVAVLQVAAMAMARTRRPSQYDVDAYDSPFVRCLEQY